VKQEANKRKRIVGEREEKFAYFRRKILQKEGSLGGTSKMAKKNVWGGIWKKERIEVVTFVNYFRKFGSALMPTKSDRVKGRDLDRI